MVIWLLLIFRFVLDVELFSVSKIFSVNLLNFVVSLEDLCKLIVDVLFVLWVNFE